jgi:hypothetical protein
MGKRSLSGYFCCPLVGSGMGFLQILEEVATLRWEFPHPPWSFVFLHAVILSYFEVKITMFNNAI